ncbi:MAG: cation:proton antiporter [Spirochaetales bacterium]|nr:cation:proton antiporter [Spirochaetales bacterium]MCF7939363.1 cation:proton antiporter [Spirochaetales bacterium]
MEILESLAGIRDTFNHHSIFAVGVMLLAGYLLGKLVSRLKLPEITGYIIAGLLMGDAFTGIVHTQMGESLKVITEVALGLIAITIGSEFYLTKLRRLGKAIIIITLSQLFLTFALVAAGLFLLGMSLPFALLLGAIASATAPAATVAIVQSLRARGRFIDYLYGVVALDDAGCVVLFGIIFAVASSLFQTGAEEISRLSMVFHAFRELGVSVLIGAISGFLLHIFTIRKNNNNEIAIISIGMIFATISIAISLHVSPLITNMVAGSILINMNPKNHRIFRILEPITPPLYALFFIIAGTELQPEVIIDPLILGYGVAFILLRMAGKYFGVSAGSALSGSDRETRKYLGFAMFPQAGVAIGLVLFIQASPLTALMDPAQKQMVVTLVNIVLFSVFVNELVGPMFSKLAIIKGNRMEES